MKTKILVFAVLAAGLLLLRWNCSQEQFSAEMVDWDGNPSQPQPTQITLTLNDKVAEATTGWSFLIEQNPDSAVYVVPREDVVRVLNTEVGPSDAPVLVYRTQTGEVVAANGYKPPEPQ